MMWPLLQILVTMAAASAPPSDWSPPEFTEEPPPLVRWSEQGAWASCRARGRPQPQVDWVAAADGEPVTTIPGVRHVSGGLVVVGARRGAGDAAVPGGALRCRASSKAGVIISRAVKFETAAESGPRVEVLVRARAGGMAVLRCLPPSPAALWLREDSALLAPPFADPEGRWLSGAGGVLVVRGVRASELRARVACSVLGVRSDSVTLDTDTAYDHESMLARHELNTVRVRAGSVVVLPCLLSEDRVPFDEEVEWLLHSMSPSRAGTSTMHVESRVRSYRAAAVLSRVQVSDAGPWSCRARAGAGDVYQVTLEVVEPLTLDIYPNPLVLKLGESSSLNCSAAGATGVVSWWREGRRAAGAGGTLTVRGGTGAEGVYQCTAESGDGGSAQASATVLLAESAPRLHATFLRRAARAGDAVSLRCAAGGLPAPQLLWLLDGRPLPADDNYRIEESTDASGNAVSVLSVSRARPADGGRYTCNATNRAGSAAHHARLDVYGPPYIRYLPPVHATTDANVTVHCPYLGYPIKEVRWLREDAPIAGTETDPGAAVAVVRTVEDALMLRGVRASDAGTYTCEVRADNGEIARRKVQLLVHKPPRLAPFQFPSAVERGESVQATCSAVSGDRPVHFVWLKDGRAPPHQLKAEQKNMEFFSLLIMAEVGAEHAGEYSCVATNEAGSTILTSELRVNEPARWVWRPQNASVTAGSALLLPCSAAGSPAPHLTWEKTTGEPILDSWSLIPAAPADGPVSDAGVAAVRLLDGALWLRAAAAAHEGSYRCRAANSAGPALLQPIYITVNEPPLVEVMGGAPWSRRGEAVSVRCVARGRDLVVHWTRNHRRLDENNDRDGVIVSSSPRADGLMSELHVARAELSHGGEYRCHAHNAHGTAAALYALQIRDKPDPPTNLQVVDMNGSHVRLGWRRGSAGERWVLQWREMRSSGVHGVLAVPGVKAIPGDWTNPDDVHNVSIHEHDLVVHARNGERSRPGVSIDPGVASSTAQYVLGPLRPGTLYAVRLAAANDVGTSTYTGIVVKTNDEAIKEPPREVRARALRPWELHVSWLPPVGSDVSPPAGYRVWWRTADAGPKMSANAGAAVEHGAAVRGAGAAAFAVRGLSASTRYQVSVAAFNAAGDGPRSAPVVVATLDGPPESPPQDIICKAESAQSLRVHWSPPKSGGRALGYVLRWSELGPDAVPGAPTELRIAMIEAYLRVLRPYTAYEIRLRAHNAAGDGPLSEPIRCITLEDVPGPPAAMKLLAAGPGGVRASWLPPDRTNGRVTHYTLYLRDIQSGEPANSTRITVEESGAGVSVGTFSDRSGESSASPGALSEGAASVRGLHEGRTYEGWLTASTSAGEGAPTPTQRATPSERVAARVTSFGGSVVLEAGGDGARLRCGAVGEPAPAVRWAAAGAQHYPLHYRMDDEALYIDKADPEASDNYTCTAWNGHGTDSVTWRVLVLRPPSAPALALAAARAHELVLDVRPRDLAGEASARAINVKYKEDGEAQPWKTTSSPAHARQVLLQGLKCGTVYHIQARAQGHTREGPPGQTLSARTSGSVPRAPDAGSVTSFVETNATWARVEGDAWGVGGGCGRAVLRISARAIEVHALSSGATYLEASGSAPELSPLQPATWYRLRVIAENEGGSVTSEYEFATTTLDGELVSRVLRGGWAADAALPAALCAVVSVSALVLALVLVRKRRGGAGAGEPMPMPEPVVNKGARPPHLAHLPPPPMLPLPPDPYELARAYTLQLRGPPRRDDDRDAAPPHTPYAPHSPHIPAAPAPAAHNTHECRGSCGESFGGGAGGAGVGGGGRRRGRRWSPPSCARHPPLNTSGHAPIYYPDSLPGCSHESSS